MSFYCWSSWQNIYSASFLFQKNIPFCTIKLYGHSGYSYICILTFLPYQAIFPLYPTSSYLLLSFLLLLPHNKTFKTTWTAGLKYQLFLILKNNPVSWPSIIFPSHTNSYSSEITAKSKMALLSWLAFGPGCWLGTQPRLLSGPSVLHRFKNRRNILHFY